MKDYELILDPDDICFNERELIPDIQFIGPLDSIFEEMDVINFEEEGVFGPGGD